MVEGLIEQGIVQQADSIEELAQKPKLPADTFKATIERYNELYDAGVDEDYGKEPFRLSVTPSISCPSPCPWPTRPRACRANGFFA
jgi:hypothetical protein